MRAGIGDGGAWVLHELFHVSRDMQEGLRVKLDALPVPTLVFGAETEKDEARALYCNNAYCALTGHTHDEVLGTSFAGLVDSRPGADGGAARAFLDGIRETGRGRRVFSCRSKSGDTHLLETFVLRLADAPDFADASAGDRFVVFQISLDQAPASRSSEGASGDDVAERPDKDALLFEMVLRRFIQRSYRERMPPAQWSALRYFRMAPQEARNLTGFARHHRTTMGTASSTVSALVDKGCLRKEGFRGPIEVTTAGESVLARDPLCLISSALLDLDDEGRQWARQILNLLAERLDGEGA